MEKSCLHRTTTFRWYKQFQRAEFSLADDPHTDWLMEAVTPENITVKKESRKTGGKKLTYHLPVDRGTYPDWCICNPFVHSARTSTNKKGLGIPFAHRGAKSTEEGTMVQKNAKTLPIRIISRCKQHRYWWRNLIVLWHTKITEQNLALWRRDTLVEDRKSLSVKKKNDRGILRKTWPRGTCYTRDTLHSNRLLVYNQIIQSIHTNQYIQICLPRVI